MELVYFSCVWRDFGGGVPVHVLFTPEISQSLAADLASKLLIWCNIWMHVNYFVLTFGSLVKS